jgi:hypothetical protein
MASNGNPKWVKGGASPNPGGRPKGTAHVATLARAYTEEAILKLVAIMRNAKAATTSQAAAAIALLDRGYGRPAQATEVTVRRDIADLTTDELIAIAAGADEEAPTETRAH